MEEIWGNVVQTWNLYGENVVFALIILAATAVIAYFVKSVLANGIDRIPFIEKANKGVAPNASMGSSIGSAGFWIVMLIGLVAALERLGLTSVSESIRGAIDEIFAYLPQVIGAALTFLVFLIVARVARQAVSATMTAAKADELPERMNLATQPVPLTQIASVTVFALLMIPGVIASMQVLDIDAITQPTVAMLNQITLVIPKIVVALVVITLFAIIARFVTKTLNTILPNTGLDNAIKSTGLLDGADAGVTPSRIVAMIAGLIILVLGLIQGTYTLGFAPLNSALEVFLTMGAQILFGAVIIFAGIFLSGVVVKAVAASGKGAADAVAGVLRWVIVILAVVLGVSRMGLDPSGVFVTQGALIILLGAAIAGGIAFGLGGKEWAAKQLDKIGK